MPRILARDVPHAPPLLLGRRCTRSEALFLTAIGAGELHVADPVPED